MANAIYNKYKEALMSAANNVSLADETVKVSLINADITTFSAVDEFYSDLTLAANGVISTATLANTSVENGVLDADDIELQSVTGVESEALLIWIDTADANTSRLVAWMDTNIDGLPITPDGSNVAITWSSSGIFKL